MAHTLRGEPLTSHDDSTSSASARMAQPATLPEIRGLFRKALAEEAGFTALKDLKLNLSGVSGFHKLYFAIRCSCRTAGMLSIEVAHSKTLEDVKLAMPQMVERLRGQARAFRAMPCEMHARMRLGGVRPPSP